MKYNLNINQKAIIENNIKIDSIDAMILDIIRDMPLSEKIEKKFIGNTVYFWINHKFLAEENPVLGIKTSDGIYRRLIKLSEIGLIYIHPDNQKMKKSFYALTDYFNSIFSHSTSDVKPNKDGYFGWKTEVTSDGKPKSTSDGKPKDNNINIDNNNKDYISFPESSSGDKKTTDFNDFYISEIPSSKSDCMTFINSNTKKVFLEKYRKEMGTEFVFSAKESGKLRSLASKVLFKMKEKSDREFSVYELNAAITFFIHSSWSVGDNYIRSKFSLSIIDSNFNDLYVKIKDQSNGKKPTVRTAAQQIREEARKFARGE